MRKIIPVCLALVLGGMFFLMVRQREQAADLFQQNSGLQQQMAVVKQAHDSVLELLRKQSEQLQKLQSEKDEAIRLRGEVTRLRQQLKEQEAELANRAARQRTNASPTENAAYKPLVESFRSVVQARLGWNQTLVTGGWKTKEGMHTFVLVDATKVSGEGPQQLELRTKYLEVPDDALANLGLAGLVSDKKDTTAHLTITREHMRALIKSLDGLPSTDLLSAPTITTLDGRQAQVKAVDVVKTPDGQQLEVGPSVDIVPSVTANGEFIDLTVLAHLNRRSQRE
jgi:hypothetical protein